MAPNKINEENIFKHVYSAHLSFEDVLSILTPMPKKLRDGNEGFLACIEKLNNEKNWVGKVTDDFRYHMEYVVKFYDTCIKEISEISEEIQEEVLPHHVQRLHKLCNAAHSLNRLFGQIWNEWAPREENVPIYKIVEKKLYADGRGLLVMLKEDLGLAASRLEDFIGRKKNSKPTMTIQQLREDLIQDQPLKAESLPTNAFKKIGEYWDIAYGGQTIHLKNRKGLQTIYILLQNPYKDCFATELYHSFKVDPETISPSRKNQVIYEDEDDEEENEPYVHGERDMNLTDPQAKKEYSRKLNKINDEIEIAQDCGDESNLTELMDYKRSILSQFRVHDHYTAIEKARKAVSKNVDSSLAVIEKENQSLYKHLFRSIKKGYSFSYQPEDPTPKWEF